MGAGNPYPSGISRSGGVARPPPAEEHAQSFAPADRTHALAVHRNGVPRGRRRSAARRVAIGRGFTLALHLLDRRPDLTHAPHLHDRIERRSFTTGAPGAPSGISLSPWLMTFPTLRSPLLQTLPRSEEHLAGRSPSRSRCE